MKTNRLPAILSFLLIPSLASAQWTSSGNDIINTNGGNVRINDNGFLIGRGHVFFYPYEGEYSNGTVYLQARQPSNTGTSINLQFRTQNGGRLSKQCTSGRMVTLELVRLIQRTLCM